MRIVDIGSKGGLHQQLLKRCDKVLCFDPLGLGMDSSGISVGKLYRRHKVSCKKFNVCVSGSAEQRPFYVLNREEHSSLYKPNFGFIKQYFGNMPDKFDINETKPVNCIMLSDVLPNQHRYDFLRISANGSEYDILKSSLNLLQNFKIMQIECLVEPIYKEAPLQDDVVKLLKSAGFKRVARIFEQNQPMTCDYIFRNKKAPKNIVERIYGTRSISLRK